MIDPPSMPYIDEDGHEYDLHEWTYIPGWEGLYKASRQGIIYSCRSCKNLAPRCNYKTGHVSVDLCRNGKCTTYTVHKLIALTFLGPPPPGKEVCHGPVGKQFNHVDNLRYGTHQSNMDDHYKRDNPLNPKAPKPVIRSDGEVFNSYYRAAKEMGVTPASIRQSVIQGTKCKGFTWRALT